MSKKIGAILLCMLLVATIPVASGLAQPEETKEAPVGILSKTQVFGLILGSRTSGYSTSFFAVCVFYKTNNLIAEDESGVIMFQRVSFVGNFNGFMGKLFVAGSFRGSI